MAIGLTQQIERRTTISYATTLKPWATVNRSSRTLKVAKHRRERMRAKADPECVPQYRRYRDFEW